MDREVGMGRKIFQALHQQKFWGGSRVEGRETDGGDGDVNGERETAPSECHSPELSCLNRWSSCWWEGRSPVQCGSSLSTVLVDTLCQVTSSGWIVVSNLCTRYSVESSVMTKVVTNLICEIPSQCGSEWTTLPGGQGRQNTDELNERTRLIIP